MFTTVHQRVYVFVMAHKTFYVTLAYKYSYQNSQWSVKNKYLTKIYFLLNLDMN